MMERLTERARQVIVLAQDEARALKHNYCGGEHLLLGLLREEEGLAARVLRSLDITVEGVRQEIIDAIGKGDVALDGVLPYTPRARKMLELSLREALSLGHNYIGTEHILLGMVRENEGEARKILDTHGATAETIRNAVIQMLSGPGRRRPVQAASEPPDALFLAYALQSIIETLAPTVDCPHIDCDRCRSEMAEALRIAKEAIA